MSEITRERYRRLVEKNHRLWKKVNELEALLNESSARKLLRKKNARIDELRSKIWVFHDAIKNLNEPMFETDDEYFADMSQTEFDLGED